ncbi:MAG: YggT family protein, partial [Anaerolineales bacterium]|nr:YggT family protein [Anaerolineales bacterium]
MLIAQIISLIFNLLTLLILARAILSWIPIDPYSRFYSVKLFIHNLTEPMLEPIRRILPPAGGMDWSPFVLLIGFIIIERLLFALL